MKKQETEEQPPGWAEGLRGRLRASAPLASRCWFQAGGPADWLYTAIDEEDLARLLRQKPDDMPLHILGVGSNLLVRDGGLSGLTLRLGRGFTGIEVRDNYQVKLGAAVLDLNAAIVARDHAIGGLEFLSGIPGTIGGALAMNAGAYGTEIRDVLIEACLMDPRGNTHQMTAQELKMSYRHCGFPEGWVFIGALLQGRPGDKDTIAQRMQEIDEERHLSQPARARTGGSTFRNPPQQKAWELIDEAGCRGLVIGDAQISEKHCNFLINRGEATAADLEALGEEARRRVREHSGMELQWEIKRIGRVIDGKGIQQ